jgi:hypothetical protein
LTNHPQCLGYICINNKLWSEAPSCVIKIFGKNKESSNNWCHYCGNSNQYKVDESDIAYIWKQKTASCEKQKPNLKSSCSWVLVFVLIFLIFTAIFSFFAPTFSVFSWKILKCYFIFSRSNNQHGCKTRSEAFKPSKVLFFLFIKTMMG